MPRAEARNAAPPAFIPLYEGVAPGSEGWERAEQADRLPDGLKIVRNVVEPGLTVFLPAAGKASGEGVIICPGGAWHFLAIEHEGVQVARWLNERGVAAFLLKYRLIQTSENFLVEIRENLANPAQMQVALEPLIPLVLADAQQAARLVRGGSAEFGISPQRIGMLGFSAGGMVTANLALQPEADCRPDFAAVIYGAPNADLPVPPSAPPLFLLYAGDDAMADGVSQKLYAAWKAGGHPVEMHVYAKGGHGFGMNQQGLPCDHWIERFYEWMKALD